jgi:hypothetical protein
MAETSYPWAGTIVGDHGRYDHDLVGAFLLSLIGDAEHNTSRGPFLGWHNELAVNPTAPASMAVVVESGSAFVGNRVYQNTYAIQFDIPANASGFTRYDRVILRRRKPEQTVRAALLVGSPGGGVPALTTIYGIQTEISLAIITVASAAATITATEIERDAQYWHERSFLLGVGDWEPVTANPEVPILDAVDGSGANQRVWEFGDSAAASYELVASVLVPPDWGDDLLTFDAWAWVLSTTTTVTPWTQYLWWYSYGDPGAPANQISAGVATKPTIQRVWQRVPVTGGIQAVSARPGEVLTLRWEYVDNYTRWEYFMGLELYARR